MVTVMDEATVGRRFLQARRRGPRAEAELASLLAEDAVCVEEGSTPVVIRGAAAIAAHLRAKAEGSVDPVGLEIVKHVSHGDGRVEGYWRRPSSDGTGVTQGRDVITIADGKVVRMQLQVLSEFTR